MQNEGEREERHLLVQQGDNSPYLQMFVYFVFILEHLHQDFPLHGADLHTDAEDEHSGDHSPGYDLILVVFLIFSLLL